MAKRSVGVFFLLFCCFLVVILRLFQISTSEEYSAVASQQSNRNFVADTSRGMIYDCNLTPLVNQKKEEKTVLLPGISSISYAKQAGLSESMIKSLQSGVPVVLDSAASPGDFARRITLTDRYQSAQPASHLIGYLDGDRKGASGLEKAYDALLSAAGADLTVSYHIDAKGRILSGADTTVRHSAYETEDGLVTTIDSRIQLVTDEVLRNSGKPGAVVVLDAKTGELRAASSAPSFNPDAIAAALNGKDSPLLNRVCNAYSVGSVFKLCVAAAALEQGISPDYTYTCKDHIEVNGKVFHCAEEKSHGTVNLQTAIGESCNCYFINLAQQVGAKNVLNMAGRLGFGTSTMLCEGISSDPGNLPSEKTLQNPIAFANFSFGQGELMATPIQIAQMVQAITNGGEYTPVSCMKGTIEDGKITAEQGGEAHTPRRAFSQETAETLMHCMIYTAETGLGRTGLPEAGGAGVKTATAQTGSFIEGKNILQTWFSGFFPAYSPKYVVVVTLENGRSGGGSCGPLFKQIADRINDFS